MINEDAMSGFATLVECLAVVRDENDEGLPAQTALVERRQQTREVQIHESDLRITRGVEELLRGGHPTLMSLMVQAKV